MQVSALAAATRRRRASVETTPHNADVNGCIHSGRLFKQKSRSLCVYAAGSASAECAISVYLMLALDAVCSAAIAKSQRKAFGGTKVVEVDGCLTTTMLVMPADRKACLSCLRWAPRGSNCHESALTTGAEQARNSNAAGPDTSSGNHKYTSVALPCYDQ